MRYLLIPYSLIIQWFPYRGGGGCLHKKSLRNRGLKLVLIHAQISILIYARVIMLGCKFLHTSGIHLILHYDKDMKKILS